MMLEYQQDNIITLKQILKIILKYKWFICFAVFIFGLCAIVYIKSRLPVFTSKVLISAPSESQANLLKLDKNLSQVIKKLQLDIKTKPHYFPFFGEKIALKYNLSNYNNQLSQPLYGLSSYAWGGEKVDISSFEVGDAWKEQSFNLLYLGSDKYQILSNNGNVIINGEVGKPQSYKLNKYVFLDVQINEILARKNTEFSIKNISFSEVIDQLKAQLSITPVSKGSSNYYVSMSGQDPKKIAAILNEVVKNFSSVEINKTLAIVNSLRSYLYGLLPEFQKRISKEESLYLKESNTYYKSLNTDGISEEDQVLLNQQELIMSQIKETVNQIANLEINKLVLQQKIKLYPKQINQYKSEMVKLDQQLLELNSQLSDLQKSLERLMGSYYNNEIAYISLISTQAKYASVVNQLGMYDDVVSSATIPVELVSRAKIPYKGAVKPASLLVLIGALLGGLILSLSIVFLWVYLRGRVDDVLKIEKLTGLNLIAEVSKPQSNRIFNRNKNTLNNKFNTTVHSLEKVRIIKSNLLTYKQPDSGLIVSLTGVEKKVDSAYIAENLSLLLSQVSSSRILVINNSSHNALCSSFRVNENGVSLLQLLKEHLSLDAVAQKTQYENISYIGFGDMSDGSADTINDRSLSELYEKLSAEYDYVIINNTPLLNHSDAIQYMRYSHVNFLVVKKDAHTDDDYNELVNIAKVAKIEYNGFIAM
ncbi:Wzz/FepE/Etk N-terminal domain-containing protein [Francisellaceae bacterium]|nr:Wzz/FepE/Etk N-terminal domain-containing protein [Francisellaceae bacterium]